MEWLHQGCDSDLLAGFVNIFEKVLQNRRVFALVSRSGFGAAISSAFARSSSVFCNSVSADRIVMAASRLLGAAAACVILLSFAAGHRKSYWNGCVKFTIMIFLAIHVKQSCRAADAVHVRLMLRANAVARRSRSWTAAAQQVRAKQARAAHVACKFYR